MKKTFVGIALTLVLLGGLSFGLTSCLNSDDTEDPLTQLLRETETIDNYLSSNNITAVEDVNGVRMVITELGEGLPATLTNKVDVDYVGKLFANNTIFDQGNTTGLLSSYIDGWKIAFSTLPAGSKATLYIPSYWGYRNSANGSIPANSILIFDVEFNEVVESSQEIQRLTSDTVAIDAYLTSKNIVAVEDTTGIRYVVSQLGGGPIPSWYDGVKMKYSFKLISNDTKVVYESDVEPTENFYSRVVDYLPGMQIALQKLPEGSKATIYVPSGRAFSTTERLDQTGQVIIPANSNLIIELELIQVVGQ
jgi:FKBP-type peptidyl-prolyl cis-trans isomerase